VAAVSENFDFKIKVVFPLLTKSLTDDDSSRITATGNFNFEPPPQVDTAQGQSVGESPVTQKEPNERVETLKSEFKDILGDLDLIEDAMKKRSGHITFKYDPELAENEVMANAEEALFGIATGSITFDQFLEVIKYQRKINKYISHTSIENEGLFTGAA
jgi:hypothetical protein